MVASLKFYTDSKRNTVAAADLNNAQVIVYEDGNGNKYTLDASSIAGLTKIDDIKLSTLKDVSFKYHPKGGSETTTTGLGSIIGALLATQSAQNGKTILTEEIVKQSVVDVLVPALATVGTDDTKKVYTKTDADTAFATKADLNNKANSADLAAKANTADVYTKTIADTTFVKTAELSAKVAEKTVVEAIFDAKDGANKISETKIGTTFVKAADLATKVAEKAVVEAIFDAKDGANKISETKIGTTFVKAADLATKVAEKAVVDAITASSNFTDKVYTKTDADTAFAKVDGANLQIPAFVTKLATGAGADGVYTKATADTAFAKVDGSNIDKVFTGKVLSAKDGAKLVLADELGKALTSQDKAQYDGTNDQTVKEFLIAKGLKPTASDVATELINNNKAALVDEVAKSPGLKADLVGSSELQTGVKNKLISDQPFKDSIKTQANAQDEGFQKAVREVTSQLVFEIPTDDSTPLSFDW